MSYCETGGLPCWNVRWMGHSPMQHGTEVWINKIYQLANLFFNPYEIVDERLAHFDPAAFSLIEESSTLVGVQSTRLGKETTREWNVWRNPMTIPDFASPSAMQLIPPNWNEGCELSHQWNDLKWCPRFPLSSFFRENFTLRHSVIFISWTLHFHCVACVH